MGKMTIDAKPRVFLYDTKQRLPPAVYEDNYRYSINYYQPMIDYLDAKQRGDTAAEPPHLPWLCERGLKRFSHHRPVREYSPKAIDQLAKEAQEKAKEQLPDYRADIKRSTFSVTQTAEATRLAKHLADVCVIERLQERLKERNERLEKLLKKEEEKRARELQGKMRAAYENQDPTLSPALKKAVRGKSARQITQILLADSLRNQKASADRDDAVRQSFYARKEAAFQRASSESRHVVRRTCRVQISDCDSSCCETQAALDKCALSSSLTNIREDLTDFTYKAEDLITGAR